MAKIHVCLVVRGALSWRKSQLKALFKRADGSSLSADEAREHLMDCLAEGKEVIPFGKPCEGFDYKKGCPGHKD